MNGPQNPKIAAMMSGLAAGDSVPLQAGSSVDNPGGLPAPRDPFSSHLQDLIDNLMDLAKEMRLVDKSPTKQDDLIDINKCIGDLQKVQRGRHQELVKRAQEKQSLPNI